MVSLSTQRARSDTTSPNLLLFSCRFRLCCISIPLANHNPPQDNNNKKTIRFYRLAQNSHSRKVLLTLICNNRFIDPITDCPTDCVAVSVTLGQFRYVSHFMAFSLFENIIIAPSVHCRHTLHTLARVPHSPSWRIESELGPGIVRSVSV